jgi:hypothetical protein
MTHPILHLVETAWLSQGDLSLSRLQMLEKHWENSVFCGEMIWFCL